MNVSVLIRYASLLLSGLMAGSSFAFVLGMGPAMERLSAGSYLELHQSLDSTVTFWSTLSYGALILLLACSLFYLRREWKSLEFVLIAFALLCIVDEIAMTWTGSLPLNRMIPSWDVVSPPAEWMEVRSQWLRFMYIRSALLVAGFGLLLASSFFMKRSLSSQQDVFAVV